MIAKLRVLLAGLIAGLVLASPAPAQADARPVTSWELCPSASGGHAHCVWDGRHMGDRRGPSFVTYATYDHGRFVIRRDRVPHRVAHRIARRVLCARYAWRCPA
jgi:hypothetical protein